MPEFKFEVGDKVSYLGSPTPLEILDRIFAMGVVEQYKVDIQGTEHWLNVKSLESVA